MPGMTASQYRAEAVACTRRAAASSDPRASQSYLEIAAAYERLAAWAEKHDRKDTAD